MFRSTKRRQRPTGGRSFRTEDTEGEDEEETGINIVQPAQKTTRRPAVVAGGRRRRQKRTPQQQQHQLSSLPYNNDDEEEQKQEEGSTAALGYSKDALAQLMAEQKASNTKRPAASVPATSTRKHQDDAMRVKFEAMDTSSIAADPEEDFIALDGRSRKSTLSAASQHGDKSKNQVLAGDEALLRSGAVSRPGLLPRNDFMDEDDMDDERMRQDLHDEVPEDEDGWEARIAHRAGISTTTTERSHTISSSSTDAPPMTPNTTLDSIRDSVARSLRQNQSQQTEIADRIRRRQQELSDTATIAHHKTQVLLVGTQLDYYQRLRNQRLCAWVGAMQEVQPKIQAVLLDKSGSLCTIQGEWAKVQEQVDWEQNVVLDVLQEQGLVEQVIGGGERQHHSMPAVAAIQQVDEFGRDVKSQHVLQRDKRRSRRRRIRAERQKPATTDSCYDDAAQEDDPDLSDGEQAKLEERHAALRAAASVAWNELDTEYTRLDGLIGVFSEWNSKYPKDYEQCYASLSLADLTCVFVQSELCQSNVWSAAGALQSDNDENEVGFRWMTSIEKAVSSHVMDAAGVDRLTEKAILPVVNCLCQQKGIHLLSDRQVSALGRLLKAAGSISDTSSPSKGLVLVRRQVEGYIQERFDDVSVPILVSAATNLSNPPNDEIDEVVGQATIGQLCRMEVIVSNVVNFLALADESLNLAQPVLDFVSQKFLFALSSLLRGQSHERGEMSSSSSPAAVLCRLHDALLPTGWLDQPELMLQSAPLRAAMAAYQ